MSDQYADPQQAAAPHAAAPQFPAEPQPEAAPPVIDAKTAWIDGYEPGNPWQSRLCLETPYGTVAYPLTPNTMPDLLEGLVVVAQEQQGITGEPDPDAQPAMDATSDGPPDHPESLHDGRTARLTGWALVHSLWEREDPRARFVMGAVVVALLLLGIVLT
ncbi:hypothetical protein I3F58_24505 [Streptomyces sp. MUM 203J]|uniref:hypothetical protein n=1 Tax=Streptomyces sp. MUM 203J TaxID=2791990 RepID=UPI001F04BC49|nr:hypothetical protein [Streptomyces sp. MUM 203J]MCH0542663.1 hypothetical protein [Streptomyces sp. MUM 203J]